MTKTEDKKSWYIKVLEALGEDGQLDLFEVHGAGTYTQRPKINPLSLKHDSENPSFALLPPINGDPRVRYFDHKDGSKGDLYDYLMDHYDDMQKVKQMLQQ